MSEIKLYIEIDPGSGFKFAGEATTSATINSLAQALVVQPRWEGDEPPQFPPPSRGTLDVSEGKLCGVLDENALLGMEIASTIDVHGLAKAAKRRGWGQERIRALVG